jgi:hypothetical protein
LDATNGYDFEASSFLACVPSCEASKVKGKPIREQWLPPFSTIFMGTLLEPSVFFFFFLSSCLLLLPLLPACIAQKKEKEKKKVQFSVTTHCYTASDREGWVA